MDFRFSIIVPTCGRRSLRQTLRSIQDQALAPGDEVLVLADGPQPAAADLFGQAGLPGHWVATEPSRNYGATQRNRGMDLAAGDYLLFMDDDDVFAPGAFATVRAALREAPGRPHLFRHRYAADGRVLWAERAVVLNNIGTPMIVFPNHPRLVRWDDFNGHDHRFVANNLGLWPAGSLVWREEVIAVVNPPLVDGRHRQHGPRIGRMPVEQCVFRERAPGGNGDVACCRLLEQVAGVDPALCQVGRDACEACCASFPPSAGEINPVVASLLYGLAGRVVERGGVPGCSAERAAGLQHRVERFLDDDVLEAPTPRCGGTPCCHLGSEIGLRPRDTADGSRGVAVHECRHPGHGQTTLADCWRCRDWAHKPGPAPPPASVVPHARSCGPAVRRWAVGVTTAPRRQATLHWCLESLIRAGWDRPRLFIDGPAAIDERFADLPFTVREPRVGAWPSYYLALAELLMREPEADAYFLIQDDVLLYDRGELRRYLEDCLWPADPLAAVSLFCSSEYTGPEPGWHAAPSPWVWGAQAFIFPRESAKRLVASREVIEHRFSGPHQGMAHISGVIGAWAARHALPIYCPTPSLAQHVGHTSTLWPEARLEGGRRAGRFAGGEGEAGCEAFR